MRNYQSLIFSPHRYAQFSVLRIQISGLILLACSLKNSKLPPERDFINLDSSIASIYYNDQNVLYISTAKKLSPE